MNSAVLEEYLRQARPACSAQGGAGTAVHMRVDGYDDIYNDYSDSYDDYSDYWDTHLETVDGDD